MARKSGSSKESDGSEGSFPFIISCGPKAPKDGAVRTLIRKQAMKDIGLARRKRGNYGKVNMRQAVVFEEDTNSPIESMVTDSSNKSTPRSSNNPGSEQTENTEYSNNQSSTAEWALSCISPINYNGTSQVTPSLSPYSAYEATRSRFCVDLTQLSVLTGWNVGRSAIPVLSADPLRLFSLMEDYQWSFLEFIPQMYESNKCLAAATDCVLAKASDVLSPNPDQSGISLRLYTKALRTLQEAISDSATSADAEVLAATQLMALCEMLDTSRTAAWASHIKGSTRLVKHRTARRFKSEFDKALFAGHVGAVVSEALINNEPCYLEAPQWIELYESLIQDTTQLTERSELVVNARKLMIYLPALWHDVDVAIQGDDLFDDMVLSGLEERCRKLHGQYLDWLEEYKAHCVRTSLTSPSQAELSLRRQIFGATIECLILVKRMLGVVCDSERLSLEVEVQALARLIMDLQNQPTPNHSWLFTGHEVGVAHTAIVTKESFDEVMGEDVGVEEKRLRMRRRYCLWSYSLRSLE